MKKVLYISFIVILVLSLCPIMSYATFDSDVWADSDAVLEKYNQTKYSKLKNTHTTIHIVGEQINLFFTIH